MKKLLFILSALCACSQGYPHNHPYNNLVRSENNLNEELPVGNPSEWEKFERIMKISSDVLGNSLFNHNQFSSTIKRTTTTAPSTDPKNEPYSNPTDESSSDPTDESSSDPTDEPSSDPTDEPSSDPTNEPSSDPTNEPSSDPTNEPSSDPTNEPSSDPTNEPSSNPTNEPSSDPTNAPSSNPTNAPSPNPTNAPSPNPTNAPSPTKSPNGGAMNYSSFSTLSAIILIQVIWKYVSQ